MTTAMMMKYYGGGTGMRKEDEEEKFGPKSSSALATLSYKNLHFPFISAVEEGVWFLLYVS